MKHPTLHTPPLPYDGDLHHPPYYDGDQTGTGGVCGSCRHADVPCVWDDCETCAYKPDAGDYDWEDSP
jgi:hypothetical protein